MRTGLQNSPAQLYELLGVLLSPFPASHTPGRGAGVHMVIRGWTAVLSRDLLHSHDLSHGFGYC